MRVIADENIPFLRGVLEPYFEVKYASGGAISAAMVANADALLVRTRTRCNAQLLENSSIRFIATATIGNDHIDVEYCGRKNIAVYTAAGCNAGAVMQYVASAIAALRSKIHKKLTDCTLGIIGVGNVGRQVCTAARALGMKTLLNDPPRAAREGTGEFVELDELLSRADIVTLHVPLAPETQNMANDTFFEKMKNGAAFINTSRGEITDEQAFINYRRKLSATAIDVWRREPRINTAALNVTDVATPHIAGYSIQGKRNATTMIVRALADFFDIEKLKNFTAQITEKETVIQLPANIEKLCADISKIYPIFDDDKLFRSQPQNFELLRNNYILRNEFIFKN